MRLKRKWSAWKARSQLSGGALRAPPLHFLAWFGQGDFLVGRLTATGLQVMERYFDLRAAGVGTSASLLHSRIWLCNAGREYLHRPECWGQGAPWGVPGGASGRCHHPQPARRLLLVPFSCVHEGVLQCTVGIFGGKRLHNGTAEGGVLEGWVGWT